MGFSVSIIAFARQDRERVLSQTGWRVTNQQVGIPVDISYGNWQKLLSPERQAANSPHFSAATTDDYFFVYVSLKELRTFERPDYARLSAIAPLTVHTVVETSDAAIVEHWQDGRQVWSIGGASRMEYESSGPTPIDLESEAEAYRTWWASIRPDLEERGIQQSDLAAENAELIVNAFSSLVGNYFARTTGFRYDGDHPDLFRLNGTLPVIDPRQKR